MFQAFCKWGYKPLKNVVELSLKEEKKNPKWDSSMQTNLFLPQQCNNKKDALTRSLSFSYLKTLAS